MSTELQGDITIVAGLVGRPVTVDELCTVIGAESDDVMATAGSLETDGVIRSEGHGYVSDPPSPSPRGAWLAGRFLELLESRNAPGVEIGRVLAAAGRHAEALPHLVKAADDGNESALIGALAIHDQHGGLDGDVEGRLRIKRAAALRSLGRSDDAFEQASLAARRLDGVAEIDALGFCAAIADDQQRPQVAEAFTGVAAAAASRAGEKAKEGSLLTLQARALSRIGYSDEAEAVMAKGTEILAEHGTPAQRRTARNNEALILLDRGEARRAASSFDQLLGADDGGNAVGRAITEIYLARALFMTGDSKRAVPLVEGAVEVCIGSGASAPIMLAHMAVAEGNIEAGRAHEALVAADAALEVVESDLPQWTNRAQFLRAQALLLAGDRLGAMEAADAGLAATPSGANGWRLRTQLTAVRMMATPDTEAWPTAEAEELTDELLQARWYGVAIPLMAERARREKDKELGIEAAALAARLGNPVAAARAIHAGGAWGEPEAIPVGLGVQDVAGTVAPGWETEWRADPAIATALEVDTNVDVDEGLLDERIDDALTAAGLAGVDTVLSPAQRRAKGLVRRKVRRRQGIPWWTWAAALFVVVGLSYGMAQLFAPEPASSTIIRETVVTTAGPTTTIAPESVVVEVDGLSGQFAAQGNVARTGEGEGGIREWSGIGWEPAEPGGLFRSLPVVYGIRAFIGSPTNDVVYSIELDTGRISREIDTDDRVIAAPAVGIVEGQRGDTNRTLVVAVSESGTLYAKEPGSPTMLFTIPLDEQVGASPLMTGRIIVVGTEDGTIYGIGSGGILWSYPAEGEERLDAITSSPSFGDGLIYVVAGFELIALDEDGNEVCRASVSAGGTSVGSPMVTDEWILVQTDAGMNRIEPGKCGPGLLDQGTPRDQAPAVADGIVYSVLGTSVFAYEPGTLTGAVVNAAGDATVGLWEAPFEAGSAITGSPAIADGVVFVGTQDGLVFGVDAATGEELWIFDAGSSIISSPAPLNGGVMVLTADGEVILITNGS